MVIKITHQKMTMTELMDAVFNTVSLMLNKHPEDDQSWSFAIALEPRDHQGLSYGIGCVTNLDDDEAALLLNGAVSYINDPRRTA
jgi:hypothetical protein